MTETYDFDLERIQTQFELLFRSMELVHDKLHFQENQPEQVVNKTIFEYSVATLSVIMVNRNKNQYQFDTGTGELLQLVEVFDRQFNHYMLEMHKVKTANLPITLIIPKKEIILKIAVDQMVYKMQAMFQLKPNAGK